MNEVRVWFGSLGSLGTSGENANFFDRLNYDRIHCSIVALYHLIKVLQGSEQSELLKKNMNELRVWFVALGRLGTSGENANFSLGRITTKFIVH